MTAAVQVVERELDYAFIRDTQWPGGRMLFVRFTPPGAGTPDDGIVYAGAMADLDVDAGGNLMGLTLSLLDGDDVTGRAPVGVEQWLSLEAEAAEVQRQRGELLASIEAAEADLIAHPTSREARAFLEGLRHAAHMMGAVPE